MKAANRETHGGRERESCKGKHIGGREIIGHSQKKGAWHESQKDQRGCMCVSHESLIFQTNILF